MQLVEEVLLISENQWNPLLDCIESPARSGSTCCSLSIEREEKATGDVQT